jgi:hypothetical protein
MSPRQQQLIGLGLFGAVALLGSQFEHGASAGSGNPMMGLVVIAVTIAGYFFPSIIAWRRGHHNLLSIFLLNLLLGWTGLGWIGALIWSASAIPAQPEKEIK